MLEIPRTQQNCTKQDEITGLNVPNNLENEVATVGAPDDCPDAHLTADHDVFASGCQGPKDFPQTNL